MYAIHCITSWFYCFFEMFCAADFIICRLFYYSPCHRYVVYAVLSIFFMNILGRNEMVQKKKRNSGEVQFTCTPFKCFFFLNQVRDLIGSLVFYIKLKVLCNCKALRYKFFFHCRHFRMQFSFGWKGNPVRHPSLYPN